ncbi:hypothetical protein F5146DRAFT_996544 [Armillaria mellea]|nr:hypothetical protein F5146DRAFT_996544 [Armillaria mellea]
MVSETRRYKDQWQGYGSQSKTILHPPPLIIRDVRIPHELQDRLVHDVIFPRSGVVLPLPPTYSGSHTTMAPSSPPYDDSAVQQLRPTYTSLGLKRVASHHQSEQILTRYFFFYGFVCPPLWLLGILVLIHPLRHVLPFLFIAGHNVETRSKEKHPVRGWCDDMPIPGDSKGRRYQGVMSVCCQRRYDNLGILITA